MFSWRGGGGIGSESGELPVATAGNDVGSAMDQSDHARRGNSGDNAPVSVSGDESTRRTSASRVGVASRMHESSLRSSVADAGYPDLDCHTCGGTLWVIDERTVMAPNAQFTYVPWRVAEAACDTASCTPYLMQRKATAHDAR
tara:strand:+ start:1610 stop:2038 length:429 start_codon:yes stop_codon:yes gene_type:complete